MGGRGSGTWLRPKRKATVESCLSISISEFTPTIYQSMSGELKWNNVFSGKEIASISFLLLPESKSEPMLILTYEHGSHAVHEPISFQDTKPHLGGVRWWFTCPMCGERVGKMYLPRKGGLFACRKCHSLTYKSSQLAKNLTSRTRSLCANVNETLPIL